MKNSKKYSVILGLLLVGAIILYFVTSSFRIKEGAESWSSATENNFLTAFNKNNQLNPYGNTMDTVKGLEGSLSEKDAQYYITNGRFNYDSAWTGALTDSIASGLPLDSMKAISVAVTREGRLVVPVVLDEAKKTPNKPSCRVDSKGNLMGNSMYMIDKDGNDKPVSNTDLPSEIPGFLFVNGPCNPCDLLSSNPKYDCPFTLKDPSGNTLPTSSVVEYLWKIGKYAPGSEPAPAPAPASSNKSSSSSSSSSWF